MLFDLFQPTSNDTLDSSSKRPACRLKLFCEFLCHALQLCGICSPWAKNCKCTKFSPYVYTIIIIAYCDLRILTIILYNSINIQ